MNKLFLTLFACVLISANARFFRQEKLRDSSDFSGAAHKTHTHTGDIYHKSTETTSEDGTIDYVTQDVALNLGLKLPNYIAKQREIMSKQLDTGMVFCGKEFIRSNSKSLRESTQGTLYSNSHAYQDAAVKDDGIVVDSTEITSAIERGQCGSNSCVPGSIVHALASFIRAQGYHVRHDDICTARSGTANVEKLINTCNLKNTVSTVAAYSCPAADDVSDQWKYDNECSVFGTNTPGETGYGASTGSSACDGASDCEENDGECIATVSFLNDTARKCVAETDNDIVPLGTPAFKNQVKRVLKYGLMEATEADVDDYQIVTGSAVGCTSLRGLVLAINGAKMEHGFVQKQHDAAEEYWQIQIDDAKKIIETIIVKITNLNGINQYFYPLENAPVYQCDSSFAAFENGIDSGTTAGPKCDLASMDRGTYKGLTHTVSMAQRSNCFCRSFKADAGDTHSVDELYLSTTTPARTICEEYRETLPSVYSFCMQYPELGDASTWTASLDRLTAEKADMPQALNSWYTVNNNNGKNGKNEVKDNFDASISGSGSKCGRISSADTAAVSFSNKGGNCVPLVGVEHIVYRLEYEFFGDQSTARKSNANNNYASVMCEANPDGDQILSFRQLAYQWQRRNVTGTDKMPQEGEINSDNIDTGVAGNNQFYDAATSAKCASGSCYAAMCSVDFAQLLGGGQAKQDAGREVADPLAFFGRVTGEAAENVQHTFSALNKVDSNTEILWDRFKNELTDTQFTTTSATAAADKRLIADIGKSAADHFMSVAAHADDGQIVGKVAMCAPSTIFADDIGAKGLKGCTAVKDITTSVSGTSFSIGQWGLYGTTSLETVSLPVFTKINDQALKGVGSNTPELSFKLAAYGKATDPGTVQATNFALDSTVQCGGECDDGYKAFKADASPLGMSTGNCDRDIDQCDTTNTRMCDIDAINQATCQFGYSRGNNTDQSTFANTISGQTNPAFISHQVKRNTEIKCKSGDSEVKSMEFYLGTSCGQLTFGDLNECTGLTHIYIHKDKDYKGQGATDTTVACALDADITGATFPASLQLLWSSSALDESTANFNSITTVVKDSSSTRYAGIADAVSFTDKQLCNKKVVTPGNPGSTIKKGGDKYPTSRDAVSIAGGTTEFDITCWEDGNVPETANVRCFDSSSKSINCASNGTFSGANVLDREVTCVTTITASAAKVTLTCTNASSISVDCITADTVTVPVGNSNDLIYADSAVTCKLDGGVTVCSGGKDVYDATSGTWTAPTLNVNVTGNLPTDFTTAIVVTSSPTAAVKGLDKCTATDAGSRSQFDSNVTTSPYGLGLIAATTTNVRAQVDSATARVFAVPAQVNCSATVKTTLNDDMALDTLYGGDLDCATQTVAGLDIVKCTQNSTTFGDYRRYKLVEAPSVFNSSYESFEFAAVGEKSPCQVTDNKASLVDLQDGNNEDGDNYCVRKIGINYIRLDAYTAQAADSSDFKKDDKVGGGTQYALLEGDATLSALTEQCPQADELVVPESVRQLGVGFLIGLNTAANVTTGTASGTNDFTLYVGQRLATDNSAVPIDDTANMLAADPNNVAVIRRACPTTSVSGANHPQYDSVTADYKNTYALNSLATKVIAGRNANEAKYYDAAASDAIKNCISLGSAAAERYP